MVVKMSNCPACGGEADLYSPEEKDELGWYHVPECTKCGARPGRYRSAKEADEAWERFAPAPAERVKLLAEVGRLREIAERLVTLSQEAAVFMKEIEPGELEVELFKSSVEILANHLASGTEIGVCP